MLERDGRSLPVVVDYEGEAVPTIRARVESWSTVYTDEASSWDVLHGSYDIRRINHSVGFVDVDACTNQAESSFSRLQRAEIGTHHHTSGRYLQACAREMAWREDNRRVPIGCQCLLGVAATLAHPVSRQWRGDWQRTATV